MIAVTTSSFGGGGGMIVVESVVVALVEPPPEAITEFTCGDVARAPTATVTVIGE